jgi:hypothetical protein
MHSVKGGQMSIWESDQTSMSHVLCRKIECDGLELRQDWRDTGTNRLSWVASSTAPMLDLTLRFAARGELVQ